MFIPWETTYLQLVLHEIGLGPNTGPVDGIEGPATRGAVVTFQLAWTYEWLDPDGIVGPLTATALARCHSLKGRIADHFTLSEFASRDTGEVQVLRHLVVGLEYLRAAQGEPLPIVSGYRTPRHNAAVGGARASQHLRGAAADIPPRLTLDAVTRLGRFSGIGYDGSSGLVRHVDVRPEFSPLDPVTWAY